MSKQPPNTKQSPVTFTLSSVHDLPGRKHRKRLSLENLPEVQQLLAAIDRGQIDSQTVARVTLSLAHMAELRITTPGRILARRIRQIILEKKARSRAGLPLEVEQFKNPDGLHQEVVVRESVAQEAIGTRRGRAA